MVTERGVELDEFARTPGLGEIGFGEDHGSGDLFQFRKCQQLIERWKTRCGTRERRYRHQKVDVRRHGLCTAARAETLEFTQARLDALYDRLSVLQQTHVYEVAGDRHKPASSHTPKLRDARQRFAVDRYPCGVL